MLLMRRLMLVLVIGVVCAPVVRAQDRADLALSNGTVFSADGSGAVYDTIVESSPFLVETLRDS